MGNYLIGSSGGWASRLTNVCRNAWKTTCCIAASYAAKARGVKVGTGVRDARALCPDIVIVQQRPALYIGYLLKRGDKQFRRTLNSDMR